jgi:formiminoglutamate deiminase
MPVFHCEWAWLGGEVAEADVAVHVEDSRITRVESGVPAPAGSGRLQGLTLPGLANAHSHAFHRALRSRTHDGGGTFWTWRDEMYALAKVLNPDSYFRLARATFAEMVCAGITCVGEFHYLHHGSGGIHYSNANAMSHALLAAANEAGLRITLLDTCYLRGGISVGVSGGLDVELNDVQRRFSDGSVEAWANRVDAMRASDVGAQARLGAAVHSVRAVDPDSIGVVAAWATKHGAPLHAHVSEQPAENDQCLRAYGRTPMQVLADSEALGDHFSAVHATHLVPSDVELLAQSGAQVCLCPTTERDLADGIGPTAELRNAGIPITLGSDSHAVIDLFEEARAVEMGERVTTFQRGSHRVSALLYAATLHGHASLGWNDAGRIEVGALADLVSISADTVRTAGMTQGNALATAIYAASPADVHHVVVGGRIVVAEHRHRSIDVVSELRASIAAVTIE